MPESERVNTYVKLSPRKRRIIECLQQRLGHKHLADTIEYLIDLALNTMSPAVIRPCLDSNDK